MAAAEPQRLALLRNPLDAGVQPLLRPMLASLLLGERLKTVAATGAEGALLRPKDPRRCRDLQMEEVEGGGHQRENPLLSKIQSLTRMRMVKYTRKEVSLLPIKQSIIFYFHYIFLFSVCIVF